MTPNTIAGHPRPFRRRLPGYTSCSARAHGRGSGAHGTILKLQQYLKESLEHLVLRQALRTSGDRGCQRGLRAS